MIQIESMKFQYGNERLFSSLSLNLTQGNIYGLLGLNGAGKTTLLKLVTGQLFSQGGAINVMGHTPEKREASFLEQISFVPEEFALPAMKGTRYVDVYAPFYPEFSREQMKHYCDELHIDMQQMLTKMSFGQKKKFTLAFALASNTCMVILDEPTNGLDIPSKSQFRRTVSSAMNDDRTIIISTHQVRDMEHLIDPLIILHDQKVVMNRYIADIEESMSVRSTAAVPSAPQPIYTENTGLGYRSLYRKEDMAESEGLDIEFLFNAVITNPHVFSTEGGMK